MIPVLTFAMVINLEHLKGSQTVPEKQLEIGWVRDFQTLSPFFLLHPNCHFIFSAVGNLIITLQNH